MIISPPLLKSSSRYGIPTIGRYGVLVLQFYEFRESCTEDFDSDYWGGVCVSNCCGDTQCLFPRRSILWLSLSLTVCLTFRFLWIVDLYWMYCLVTIPTCTTSTIVGEKSGITDPQLPSSQFVSPSTTHHERTDSSLGFSTREFLVSTSSQGGRRLAIR